jgi:hypothetical protein
MTIEWFLTPLTQDPRVAALNSPARPEADRPFLRCVLGIISDDGETDAVVVRQCDPNDAADHRWYWPMTISMRWRFAQGGVSIPGAERPSKAVYDVIMDRVERALERRAILNSPAASNTVEKT